jgi:hypothetical protein
VKKFLLYILFLFGLCSAFQSKDLSLITLYNSDPDSVEVYEAVLENSSEDYDVNWQQTHYLLPSQFVVSYEHQTSFRHHQSIKQWVTHHFSTDKLKVLFKSVVQSRCLFCSYITNRGYYIYFLRKILI